MQVFQVIQRLKHRLGEAAVERSGTHFHCQVGSTGTSPSFASSNFGFSTFSGASAITRKGHSSNVSQRVGVLGLI